MKAILMAAGMGTRISSETNKPKSLLPLINESLLKHTVGMLLERNIEVIVITGYKSEFIEEELKDMNVKIYYSPFYRVSNSIASLWFAREELKDQDIILMNADVFVHEDILDIAIKEKEYVSMYADSSRVDKGDYFFQTHDGFLVNYGKELKRSERDCEYIGVAKLRSQFLPIFTDRLNDMIKAEKYDLWWENVLYTLNDKMKIYVRDVSGLFWGEVDTKEDYKNILNYFQMSYVKS